jgi:hypothetical protein
MMKNLTAILLLALLAACASPTAAPKQQARSKGMAIFPAVPAGPQDAQPEPQLVVSLSIYQIVVPAHTVSANEEFWKHMAEDGVVDVAAHDRLYANGIRVGIAPRADWDYFRNILESNSLICRKTGATGGSAPSSLELPLKKNIVQQFITFFHPTNGLVGQMYDRCDNALAIRFEAVPRKVGDVRVTVTPLLRAERTELMYTVRDEPQELKFTRPEYFFDLKLGVDIPLDNFLVIAPSTDAELSTSIGRRFLFQESDGQEFETVFVISPQPFQVQEKDATPTTQPSGPNPRLVNQQ